MSNARGARADDAHHDRARVRSAAARDVDGGALDRRFAQHHAMAGEAHLLLLRAEPGLRDAAHVRRRQLERRAHAAIERCERALACLRLDPQRQRWATVEVELGGVLAQSAIAAAADRVEDLRHAPGHLRTGRRERPQARDQGRRFVRPRKLESLTAHRCAPRGSRSPAP